MNNNNKNTDIKPLIFTKKLNDKSKLIPLNTTMNTLGPTRHFPPATKEWFNSIYTYNNNSIKNLSIADKNLSRLIKSYFNLYFSQNIVKHRQLPTRFKRLSLKKIFVSKAELKHTNSKVIVTLYIYNEEKRVLINRLNRLTALLWPTIITNKTDKTSTLKNKLSILKEMKSKAMFFLIKLEEGLKLEILKLNTKINLIESPDLSSKGKIQFMIEDLEYDLHYINNIITRCKSDAEYFKQCSNIFGHIFRKAILEDEMKLLAHYNLLLNLNESKFDDVLLSKLKPLIKTIYNKEVELNIVNLKTLYLNSDIFTEAISLKLKNRDNRLLRVLRSALHMVKLPKVNRIREKYGDGGLEKELWVNKVKNLSVSSVMGKFINNEDTLNQLLLDLYPNSYLNKTTSDEKGKVVLNKKVDADNTLEGVVLNSLKHKRMAGVRLEARGRLTKRFTASRSVLKIKWKGSLKNIDSSYRGLSSVILRGHLKSNVQYSIINSKTRNGAFGLRGWISSK